MGRLRYRGLALTVYALACAQLGHMVAYTLKLGPGQAAALQSQGIHAYFPTAGRLAAALLGAALILALLTVGAARMLAGRQRRLPVQTGWRWLDAFAILFTLQLAIFAGQETIEAMLAGAPLAPLPGLLLWGAAGQLPVAAAGALALSWLSARLVPALCELRALASTSPPLRPVPPSTVSGWQGHVLSPLRVCAPAVFSKRGPPRTLLLHQLP